MYLHLHQQITKINMTHSFTYLQNIRQIGFSPLLACMGLY